MDRNPLAEALAAAALAGPLTGGGLVERWAEALGKKPRWLGALVELDTVAERLGVTLTEDEDEALQSTANKADAPPDGKAAATATTANTKAARRLRELVEEALRTHNAPFEESQHPRDAQGEFADSETRGVRYPNPLTPEERTALQAEGDKAMDAAIREKRDVPDAMTRPDISPITFLYGEAGGPAPGFKGAHGVAGIIAKHGEASARKMPEVIAHGELGPLYEQGGKRNVYYQGSTAIIALQRRGKKLTWLLNGFRPEAEEKK